jgi:hypothetical protein
MRSANSFKLYFQILLVHFKSLLKHSKLHVDDPHVAISNGHIYLAVAVFGTPCCLSHEFKLMILSQSLSFLPPSLFTPFSQP